MLPQLETIMDKWPNDLKVGDIVLYKGKEARVLDYYHGGMYHIMVRTTDNMYGHHDMYAVVTRTKLEVLS